MTGLIDPEVAMAPLALAEKSQLSEAADARSSTRKMSARSWGHVPIRDSISATATDQIPDQSQDEIRLFGPCLGRRAEGGKDNPSVFNSFNEF